MGFLQGIINWIFEKIRQELGLEYGPVNYFMMCDPKYANDLGEVVQ